MDIKLGLHRMRTIFFAAGNKSQVAAYQAKHSISFIRPLTVQPISTTGGSSAAPLPIPFASWNDENSSGMPALDEQHRDFFLDLNRLCSSSDEAFVSLYTAFVGKVERMFRQEEQWMEKADSSTFLLHQEQHARALSALHNVHYRVMDGDICLGRRVAKELLPQWMAIHMATMDTLLAIETQLCDTEIALSNSLEAAAIPS